MGIAAGLFLGFALGAALAAALHVPSREGEAGYFTVAIALIVTCIVTPVSILVTLYWRGARSIWLFIGLVMVCVSIAATSIWFGNLVCSSTACSQPQRADTASRIRSETAAGQSPKLLLTLSRSRH